jgi:hypothetical protein
LRAELLMARNYFAIAVPVPACWKNRCFSSLKKEQVASLMVI